MILPPALAKEVALTAQQQKAGGPKIVRAVYELIVHQTSMVTSASDFERIILKDFSDADRSAVMSYMRTAKDFPTLKIVGDKLVADDGLRRFDLKWQGFSKYEFEINGVAWTYNPKQPLMTQIESLHEKIRARKNASFPEWSWLPEAEANPILIPILIGLACATLGVVASDSAKEGWCTWDPLGTADCADLRRKKDEALHKDAPSLDAVANQVGTDNKNILAQYESKDWNCPTNNDGKDREYRGVLRKVRQVDGKTVPDSGWFNVVAKFKNDGQPTDLIITRENADPATIDTSSKAAKESLVLHVAFDPTKRKPISYRFPNPTYNEHRDLLGSPTVTVKVAQKLTPEQQDSIDRAKDIIKFINYRNYNCVAKRVMEEQLAGVETPAPGTTTPPSASGGSAIIK